MDTPKRIRLPNIRLKIIANFFIKKRIPHFFKWRDGSTTEKDLEYINNKLLRKISGNLAIEYTLYINDYSLTAKGHLLDIENNKNLTEDIFQFECSGTYSYDDLEYLFEIFNANDLNEYIVN